MFKDNICVSIFTKIGSKTCLIAGVIVWLLIYLSIVEKFFHFTFDFSVIESSWKRTATNHPKQSGGRRLPANYSGATQLYYRRRKENYPPTATATGICIGLLFRFIIKATDIILYKCASEPLLQCME